MAQWGTGDDHANSVSYAPQQFKVEANTANRQALYGNTTAAQSMITKSKLV